MMDTNDMAPEPPFDPDNPDYEKMLPKHSQEAHRFQVLQEQVDRIEAKLDELLATVQRTVGTIEGFSNSPMAGPLMKMLGKRG